MKFDMHTHTIYSKHWFFGIDALNYPKDMIKAAVRAGLDGMAITDHNNVRGSLIGLKEAKSISKSFKIITGTEIRSAKGDILAYGIKENVKPMMSVEETVERIHDLGGIAVAAHPFSEFLFRNVLQEESRKTDAVEVFNATNSIPLQNLKAKAFARQYNMPVSAGSDSHCILSVGNAGIICDGDPLQAIMKKKVRIFGKYTPYKDTAFQMLEKFGRSAKWLVFRKEKRHVVSEINK